MAARSLGSDSDTAKDGTNVASSLEAKEYTQSPPPYHTDPDSKGFLAGSRKTTFANESLESFYKPIESYEGYHRFDPNFQWEPKEEKKVVRRIDFKICAWVCLMFFALQLDRGNINQALTDNLLDDLGMNTDDYNLGQTLFYICFLCAELPSQLISKKLGPDNWMYVVVPALTYLVADLDSPIQMVSWSLVASCQAFMKNRSGFLATRALLGMIEGGFIPDNILYLSYFYTGSELPVRLSFFWVAYQSTNIVSAFFAYGLLHLRGHNGLPGWAWLFALEGMLTGLIGIVSYFYLPPSPTQTASWFRGKNGWFSEREEKIMVNRILRDDPGKGDMHNREGLSLTMLWRTLCDWHMWPIYILGLMWLLPTTPNTAYLTLNLKSAGFTTFQTNLLTIPAYCIFIIALLFWTWLSEKLNERFLLATVSQFWCLPMLVSLAVLPPSRGSWTVWTLTTLLFGQPYVHAIIVAITSRNAGSVRTRTVASAIYNMTVQASNIIGSNIYRDDDKPYYYRGNRVLIGICVANIFLFVGAKVFYVLINRHRERKWNAMSREEKEHYLATTTDQGNKRLDFRFAH